MPTRKFDLFSADEAAAMRLAFDAAWLRLSEEDEVATDPPRSEAIRAALVERIIEAAREGNSDPHRLVETALQTLREGPQRH